MCVELLRVFDGGVRMKFVKLGFVDGEFRSYLNDYGRRLLSALQTERCVLREQMFYAGQDFEAQEQLWNILRLIRELNDRKRRCKLETCYCCFGA